MPVKPPKGFEERRYDRYGEFRCLAHAEGYLMVRRFGRGVSIMSVEQWNKMPVVEDKVTVLPTPFPAFGSGNFKLEIP